MLTERFRELAARVAVHLAGYPVTVALAAPPARFKCGYFQLVEHTGLVMLDPAMAEEEAVKVALHETAHAVLFRPPAPQGAAPARETKAAALPEALVLRVHECAASALALEWRLWAQARGRTPEEQLQALLSYPG